MNEIDTNIWLSNTTDKKFPGITPSFDKSNHHESGDKSLHSKLNHRFLSSMVFMLILCLNLSSCEIANSSKIFHTQPLSSRDDGSPNSRALLYQTTVPQNWIRKDPSENESILDTKKANCEFFIHENNQQVRITIHTFPYSDDSQRIPPQAQIQRWKKQFDHYNSITLITNSCSQSGFYGYFFEVEGMINHEPITMMGWSMQLSPLFDRALKYDQDNQAQIKRADFTIKVTGPPELVSKNREDILIFAQHFEFIDELPLSL